MTEIIQQQINNQQQQQQQLNQQQFQQQQHHQYQQHQPQQLLHQQNPTRIKIKASNNSTEQHTRSQQEQEQHPEQSQSSTTTRLKLRVKPPQPQLNHHPKSNNTSNSHHPTLQQINQIRSHGSQLWNQIVKTTDTDGRIMSFQFMDLPSVLHYPDYYQYIKHPIALNLIRAKLDSDRDPYLSFDHLRADLKRVFNNAKKYNREESEIYKDAKTLSKIVRKAPSPEQAESLPNNHQNQSQSSEPKQKKLKINFKLAPPQSPTPNLPTNTLHSTPATVIIPPSPTLTKLPSHPSQPEPRDHPPNVQAQPPIRLPIQNSQTQPNQVSAGISQQEISRIQAELIVQTEARLKAREEARQLELRNQEHTRKQQEDRQNELRQQAQANQLQLRQQAQSQMLTPPDQLPTPTAIESQPPQAQPSVSTPSLASTQAQINTATPAPSQAQLPQQTQLPVQTSNPIPSQLPSTSSPPINLDHRPKTPPPSSKPTPIIPTQSSPSKLSLNKNDAIKLKLWLTIILEKLESITDRTGRKLIEEFLTLPDKIRWKAYYQIITEPIAFQNIQSRNNRQGYTDFVSFKEDVLRIFKNAQHFNEGGSMVWNDSQVLQAKFLELIRHPPADIANLVLPHLPKLESETVDEARPVTPPGSINGLGKRKAAERKTPSKQVTSTSSSLVAPVATVALRRSSRSPSRPTPSRGSPISRLSSRPVSPLPRRDISPTPTTASRTVVQPLQRTNNNDIVVPSQLLASALRPTSRLANDISPALLSISSSNHNLTSSHINVASNQLEPTPAPIAPRIRSMAPIPVKVSERHPPMMTRFKISSRPKTMENLKIMNQHVFQHAFKVPRMTKVIIIETELNRSWPLTRQLRSADRHGSIKVKIESIKIQGKFHPGFNPINNSNQDSNNNGKEKYRHKERNNGLVSIEVDLVDGMNVIEYLVMGKTTDNNTHLISSNGHHHPSNPNSNSTINPNLHDIGNSVMSNNKNINNINGFLLNSQISCTASNTPSSSPFSGSGGADTSSGLVKETYRLLVYR